MRRTLLTLTAVVVSISLPTAHAGGDHGDGHGHSHGPAPAVNKFLFEWAGGFDKTTNNSTFIFQRKNELYGETHVVFSIHEIPDASFSTDFSAETVKEKLAAMLEKAEDEAVKAWGEKDSPSAAWTNETYAVLNSGDTITDKDKLYKVVFSGPFTALTLPAQPKPWAIYFEHIPLEFEDYTHYLKSATGGDVGPKVTETFAVAAPAKEFKKGTAIVAAILVSLVSFIGVIFASNQIVKLVGDINTFRGNSCAFASGALLYCALAIMWPEGLVKLNGAFKTDHSMANANFASAAAAGIALCMLLDMAAPALLKHKAAAAPVVPEGGQVAVPEPASAQDVGAPESQKATDIEWIKPKSFCDFSAMQALSIQVVFGDFFHNIVDGVIIGTAFKSCSDTVAWTVTAGTIYHEIAQEVADFLVLITKGGLSFSQAILGNFISALGCIIGTLAVISTDPSQQALGCLLAFGGGVYVHIALGELNWWGDNSGFKVMATRSFLFFLGCLGIGLVLLSHEHCDGGGEGHGHAH